LLPRSSKSAVYQQIVMDLNDAQKSLSTDYIGADGQSITSEKVRPNRWTATALLARVYLYTEKWDSAKSTADAIINSGIYSLDSLNDVFLMNSSEAIWQLQPVSGFWNTEDAHVFILPGSGPDNFFYPIYLSSNLLDSFEPADERRINWVDSVTANGTTYYYPYKYKSATSGDPITEYLMVFRLAEQYLIRAEANARLNDLTGAANDLDIIRSRAGLGGTTATNLTDLISAIGHERQIELFTEWGHRWLDLKREGTVNSVMAVATPQKGGSWNSNWQLYPLPVNDVKTDPNLTQNPGY
jgi:hypothetical protein